MNMLDYLDWRGDLSFAAAPFNEVDALICAWLSYYNWDDLLHNADFHGKVSLHDLGKRQFSELGPAPKLNLNFTVDPSLSATLLLTRLYDTERYRAMYLTRFREIFDERKGIQFAAATFSAESAPCIVAYRGTDTSLAGWKEDFELSYLAHVPAQDLALQYLETESLPAEGGAVLCGHSKGGNLALYAALNGKEAALRRIALLYNFDGPGFRTPIQDMPLYGQAREKIVTIVPESSIVGMLLEHPEDYRVVKSDMASILQHNGMMWHVMGNHFVYADRVNLSSVMVDKTMEDWLSKLDLRQRQEAVEIVFSVLETTGVHNYPDLTDHAARNMLLLIKGAAHLTGEQKRLAFRLLLEMIRAGNASAYDALLRSASMPEWLDGLLRRREKEK